MQCAHTLLDSLGAAAREGFTRFPHGGVEVGGILLGTLQGDTVRITEARPLPIEYANGARFSLSEADQEGLRKLIEANSGKVAGWYVSHARRDLTPNPSDLAIFDAFFGRPWQVYMIVKPDPQDGASMAVYCRGDDGVLLEYTEGEDVQSEEAPPVEAAAPPLFLQTAPQQSTMKYWAAGLALAACAGFAWFAGGGVKQPVPPPVTTVLPAAVAPAPAPEPAVPPPQVQASTGQRQRKAKRVHSRKRHTTRKSKAAG